MIKQLSTPLQQVKLDLLNCLSMESTLETQMGSVDPQGLRGIRFSRPTPPNMLARNHMQNLERNHYDQNNASARKTLSTVG